MIYYTEGLNCRTARFQHGGAKVQVTGSQVTGHRSQVAIKNTCEFVVSSYLVRIIYFVFVLVCIGLFIPF